MSFRTFSRPDTVILSNGRGGPPIWTVQNQLLTLSSSGDSTLSSEDAEQAHTIIDELLELTPIKHRKATVIRLSKFLPGCFVPVIEKILNDTIYG